MDLGNSRGRPRRRRARWIDLGIASAPETLARVGLKDGVRLVRCLEGFEGEAWRDGDLVASRWWPATPSAQEWNFFLRGAKNAPVGPAAAAPAAEEPQWRLEPPLLQPDADALSVTLSPARVAAILAVAALGASAHETTRYALNAAGAAGLERRVNAGQSANADAARARRAAQARAAEAARLAGAGDERLVISALGEIFDALPPDSAAIRRVRYTDNEMQVRVRTLKQIDAPALVAALEASPLFTDVFVDAAASTATLRSAPPPRRRSSNGRAARDRTRY